jgi:hypothetical protein
MELRPQKPITIGHHSNNDSKGLLEIRYIYLFVPTNSNNDKGGPRADIHLSPLVEDEVSIIIPNTLGEVDIRIVQLAVDIMQASP